MVRDLAKGVDILVKDLKVFAVFNEELFKEITQLLTLENFRDNEQLSKYGDTKPARGIMLAELKTLIKANPLFRDKLQFPTLKNSRLRTLISQRCSLLLAFELQFKLAASAILEPFQPTLAVLSTSLAGWMANPSPVPHPSASAGPIGLTAPNNAGAAGMAVGEEEACGVECVTFQKWVKAKEIKTQRRVSKNFVVIALLCHQSRHGKRYHSL
ncbi:hypothetical protein Pint_12170 [Pistacia integerrima]|uniref:Uncharacterized protein n=1 Tax=Pistacia integerrima TaxID=434235 RepID=A0ACC0XGC4_9ROSI|nr:hypothetical protein Pint_12170 [Pistacia integerrima]